MTEQFEVLPFGGRQGESELERQIMRGGGARGGGRRPPTRTSIRPAVQPKSHHDRPHQHGPRGLRYPHAWPYWAPAYWGWSYPAAAAVNVFDDSGGQDGTQDGDPDDSGDMPVQGETLRPHRAGCRCAGCCGPTFDVLPFTVTQLAALEGRNNWRSRRK